MKCSESTTILCTCSATRQNARMQQVRANIIGADNTIMLSLAISRRHDLEIQLPDLLLDDFDTIAIERIKLCAQVMRRLSDFFFRTCFACLDTFSYSIFFMPYREMDFQISR